MPLGIYIHIPFCISKCAYCDFVSYAGRDNQQAAYFNALIKEIRLKAATLDFGVNRKVRSIFFGGGTPSYVPTEYITQILSELAYYFVLTPDCEITLEGNPESLNSIPRIETYRQSGINRISIGTQSFDDHILAIMNRPHKSDMITHTVQNVRAAGIDNFNLDLIFGYPEQTQIQWKDSLQKALALKPSHLSLYGLTVEPNTRLDVQIRSKQLPEPDDDTSVSMYLEAEEELSHQGYHHYEISNWSLPSLECQHNLNYWKFGNYLGFGLNAHSYLAGKRSWNTDNLNDYIHSLNSKKLPESDSEVLTGRHQMAEYCMVTMRLREGIHRQTFITRFGTDVADAFGQVLHQYESTGMIEISPDYVRLTIQGILFSDSIFSDLLSDTDFSENE